MTKKTKFLLKNIFSLGFYGAIVKAKAKKQMQHTNEELKVSKVEIDNISDVIIHFGGAENIESVDNSIYGIKVLVKDINLVDIKALKVDLEATGSIISGNKVTINIGDNAATVANQLKERLNLN